MLPSSILIKKSPNFFLFLVYFCLFSQVKQMEWSGLHEIQMVYLEFIWSPDELQCTFGQVFYQKSTWTLDGLYINWWSLSEIHLESIGKGKVLLPVCSVGGFEGGRTKDSIYFFFLDVYTGTDTCYGLVCYFTVICEKQFTVKTEKTWNTMFRSILHGKNTLQHHWVLSHLLQSEHQIEFYDEFRP